MGTVKLLATLALDSVVGFVDGNDETEGLLVWPGWRDLLFGLWLPFSIAVAWALLHG